MKLYTVKQLAKLAGISVRALHHYDDIGLLKPASVGDNGYRYYGREELLRLQQILFYRELNFPLEAIAAVLAQPGFDRLTALRGHRDKLAAEARRYRRLLRTLDDTLAALNGEAEMEDRNLYKGFSPEKQAEHEAWLVDRYGGDMQAKIDRTRSNMNRWTAAEREAFAADQKAITADAARALAEGQPADGEAMAQVMRRHYFWIERAWDGKPSAEGFTGLGQLYLDHPDFRAGYDQVQPGLAEYMAAAMKAYAQKVL